MGGGYREGELLQEAINDEESKELSPEEVAKEQRVVFVVHSEEAAKALEEFASDEVRLASVVPGRGGYSRETGVKGSWLVFERAGEVRAVGPGRTGEGFVLRGRAFRPELGL